MITFDIITIFPKIFDSYLKESLIKKAQKTGKISIRTHDLRKWTKGPHKTVDDRPYGGGLGMVLKIEPIFKAIEDIKKTKRVSNQKRKIVFFTPRGKQFNQKLAFNFSKLKHIIFICGRYEGVDERVAKHIADLELSIGPYDLMGGDLPVMVVIETVARLIPGVLGKPQLLKERITKTKGFIEYPQYTRPEIFSPPHLKKVSGGKPKKRVLWRVPKVLMSGNHKKIEEWRKKNQKIIEK